MVGENKAKGDIAPLPNWHFPARHVLADVWHRATPMQLDEDWALKTSIQTKEK